MGVIKHKTSFQAIFPCPVFPNLFFVKVKGKEQARFNDLSVCVCIYFSNGKSGMEAFFLK